MVAPSPAVATTLWTALEQNGSGQVTVHSWQTPSTQRLLDGHGCSVLQLTEQLPEQPQTFSCPPPPHVSGAVQVARPQETVPLSQPFEIEPQFIGDGQEVLGLQTHCPLSH